MQNVALTAVARLRLSNRVAHLVLFVFFLTFLLVVTPISVIWAQTYDFSVPRLRMQVFVQQDGSAHIVYDITLHNTPGAETIRIIDLGLPGDNYDISNMRASIDGEALNDIRVSDLIDTGVEIHLQDRPISSGESAILHFEFTMPDMVFQDTTDADYASLRISPTWFDVGMISGTSEIEVVIHTLPDIDESELLYQDLPFTGKINFEDHAVASWKWSDGRATEEHLVGISFPKRGMTNVIEQSQIDLAIEWLEDNPNVRIVLGLATLALIVLAFLRFTGGTGITLVVIIAAVVAFLLFSNPLWQLILLPLSIILAVLVEWGLSRRKLSYLPAIVQVEGGGIKRGLTAPEAAVILELPLNKILTLLLFGLLEKAVIRQTSDDPLKVEVTPEFLNAQLEGEDLQAFRLKVAQNLGIVIRLYEHRFIDKLEKRPEVPVQDLDFSRPMKALIKHTVSRMKGFDLSDTQDYYRAIIKKALDRARSIGDIPERERYLDKNLQWLLLDDDYPTVFRAPNYHYRPVWIRPFHSSDRIGVPSAGRSPAPGRTSFTDVAASFSGWTEKTMGNLANAIAPDALQVEGPAGAVNLSGIDAVTGDVFKALSESSSSGGGGSGGGCACACAGCACACACAGGGR